MKTDRYLIRDKTSYVMVLDSANQYRVVWRSEYVVTRAAIRRIAGEAARWVAEQA